jgi:hypothetical protein
VKHGFQGAKESKEGAAVESHICESAFIKEESTTAKNLGFAPGFLFAVLISNPRV